MGHTPYFQNLVRALIEKRGIPKDKAYKIAYGALRKWRRGGGGVHPEVVAAATGALAGEAARGARAKAAHGHSSGDPLQRIDLALAAACRNIDLVGPKGYTHNWVYHGAPGMSPEDRADSLSHHLAHHTLPGNVPAHAAHLEAARLHRHAANLTSSAPESARHTRMARHHALMARRAGVGLSGQPPKVIELWNPAQPRVAAGSAGGGQFSAGGAAPAAAGKAAGKPHGKKAALLTQAAGLDQQASRLSRTLRAMMLAMRIANRSHGATAHHGKPGKAGKSNNPAPAKKGGPAKKAARAGAGTRSRGPSQLSSNMSTARKIVALRIKIRALRVQAKALRAQAAKL